MTDQLERNVHVVLKADVRRFVTAMKNAGAAMLAMQRRIDRLRAKAAHLRHQRRFHRREDPARSAMHAAYDRRRRARRRRNR